MALNLRLVGATGLVAVGVAAAAIAGQLPAFGVSEHVLVATPSSAPQSLVCPGAAIAVGASGTDVSALSATGTPSRVSGTAGGVKPTTTSLSRGGVSGGAGPKALSAPAERRAGAIAGAQAEQAVGDAAGLVATACTAPQSDLWFAAGSTTTGRTTVLTLANPSSVAAQVTVRTWTEAGAVDSTSSNVVTVRAKSRTAVSLAGIAPSAGGLVVRVTSRGGRVAAALEQRTVRGLESGGVDMTGPTTGPATTQVVPGVRVASAVAVTATQSEDDFGDLQPVVRVFLPGSASADVRIAVVPDGGGQAVTLGRTVAARVVTDFPVSGLVDGTYTVHVTAAVPVVTGVRTSTVADSSASSTPTDSSSASSGASGSGAAVGSDAGLVGGDGPAEGSVSDSSSGAASSGTATSTARGIDLAWFAAAPELTATAALAVVDASSPVITIANPGPARTVRLSGAVAQSVRVPSKSAVAVPATTGVVVLTGATGLRAAVSYAGTDAIAGYPAVPADQQAQAVRISQ